MNDRCQNWTIIFAGDSNAHLGSETSESVGSFGACQENIAGQTFRQWLIRHRMYAPSTFQECHSGDHSTFLSVRGQHGHRLDYIGVSQTIAKTDVQTWTDHTIDLSIDLSAGRVRFWFMADHQPTKRRGKTMGGGHIATWLQDPQGQSQLFHALQIPAWNMDVHTQAHDLACSTRAVTPFYKGMKQSFRKRHLSDDTQQLVRFKQSQFRHLRELQLASRRHLCAIIFRAWKTGDCQSRLITECQDTKLCVAIAQTERSLRILGAQTRSAIRAEDARFIENLAYGAGQAFEHEGLTGLWRSLKMFLPKQRQRRDCQRRDIAEALHAHFQQLEAGRPTTWDNLHSRCCSRQLDSDLQQGGLIPLHELPTLSEVEFHCRRQQSKKAPGPDGIVSEVCHYGAVAVAPALHNLLLKSFLEGREPVWYKGGHLHALYKGKGSRLDPAGYRGILLANTFAKVSHSWCRAKLLPSYEASARTGQLGGLRHQQTNTAIHLLRLHTKCGCALTVTTSVLFIDVKAAFHHLIRDFVFSLSGDIKPASLHRFLDSAEHDADAVAQKVKVAFETNKQAIPPILRRYLNDVHTHTWYKLACAAFQDDTCVVETERGTRPGSPLADVGFNLLVTELLREIEVKLAACDLYRHGMDKLGGAFPPVAWVDDVAIPLAVEEPGQMMTLLKSVAESVHECFYGAGLTLNLSRGKTEAVVSFRGRGADTHRMTLFLDQPDPGIVCATSSHVFTLRIAAMYKHLGSRYTCDADLTQEIHSRIAAMANQAFQEMRKPIFLNRFIGSKARIHLLHSLVISRLMYGAAVWTDLAPATLRKLESFLMKKYRSILDIGFWKAETGVNDRALRSFHELPTFRVLWAKMRLCYLRHVATMKPNFYRDALLAELQRNQGWLFEVTADLEWMNHHVRLPFSIPSTPADWDCVCQTLASFMHWKSMVNRAVRLHLAKEKLAWQTNHFHDLIFQEFQDAGLAGSSSDEGTDDDHEWPCDLCSQAFNTKQKLVVHRVRKHQCLSDERAFIQSTVCGGCLFNFWTTKRLQQHLAHRENGCFNKLHGARLPDDTVNIDLPQHLRGVKRLMAYRNLRGPLRPTPRERAIVMTRISLTQLTARGQDIGAWLHAEDLADYNRLLASFDKSFHAFLSDHHDDALLHSNLLQPPDLEREDTHVACVLHSWIETRLHDSDNRCDRGSLKALQGDLGLHHCRAEHTRLAQYLHDLHSADDLMPRPRRDAGAPRPRDRLRCIPDPLGLERDFEDERHIKRWTFSPRPSRLLQPKYRLLVHLYFGRRRFGDIHAWMQHFVSDDPAYIVVSIDTAVDARMNVTHDSVWNMLISAGREGFIHGLILGPPCETWSAARHEPVPNRRAPRPIRLAEAPWGCVDIFLTHRELSQLTVGSLLLLRGLWLAIVVGLTGGGVILEHPAESPFPDRASIWRTAVFKTLLRFFPAFYKVTFEQWPFGSAGVKPTTLLCANVDVPRWLEAHRDVTRVRPSQALIGRTATGEYRTAAAKEYPLRLCHLCASGCFWGRTARTQLDGVGARICGFVCQFWERQHSAGLSTDRLKSCMYIVTSSSLMTGKKL